MKLVLRKFRFIPFVKRMVDRRYYACGFTVYFMSSLFKRIFGFARKADFIVNFTSRINSPENLAIGNGRSSSSVYLSLLTSGGCYYQCINGILIGEGTMWANNCSFISANHSSSDYGRHIKSPPISIGKNVWIGSSVVVLPGVQIGDNAVIGAGSVVTKSIEKFTLSVGNPAKVIAFLCENCLEKIDNQVKTKYCNNCKE